MTFYVNYENVSFKVTKMHQKQAYSKNLIEMFVYIFEPYITLNWNPGEKNCGKYKKTLKVNLL